jgi:hypothetical protein
MKTRYRAWHLPVLSFYSHRLYRDIATRWKGTNLGFLFLLLAVCLIPTSHHISKKISASLDQLSDIYLMQIPELHIIDGRVATDAPQPYSIIEGNRTVLIIDTTGQINTIDEAGADALLTSSQLIIGQAGRPDQVFDLASIKNLRINQSVVAEGIESLKKMIAPFYYILGLIFSYLLFVLSALLCGAIALLFASIQQKKITYAAGLRLAVTAFTPALLVSTALKSLIRPIPPILYILLALTYLYMAVGAVRKAQNSELYLDEQPVPH